MKPTKYRVYLSDGNKIDIESQNAGEAIEGALRKYRGRKVITCISGQSSANGKIEYEVPNHEAIAEDVVFAKSRGRNQTPRKQCSRIQKSRVLADSLTNMTKLRTKREVAELDRLIAWHADRNAPMKTIASECEISRAYLSARLKYLGYATTLLSPWEIDLIRESRRQRSAA